MKKLALPLKWHGGKNFLASKIVAMMPPHIHYVEPYAGGLSVLLAKDPEGVSEVVNDVNGGLINFWRVLASDQMFPKFRRLCEATPFAQDFWPVVANDVGPWKNQAAQVDAAWRFFCHIRLSLAGRGKCFAPLSRTRTRRNMNEQASAWLGAIEGLTEVHERMKRVVILNDDAVKVIEQQDGPQTLYYLDPPYVHSTRATTDEYQYEMTDQQHDKLLTVLGTIKGKFLLSGYRSSMYDDAVKALDWHRVEFEIPNNAASGKTKRTMTECVWTNFKPVNQ